jgi:hypothetical protein
VKRSNIVIIISIIVLALIVIAVVVSYSTGGVKTLELKKVPIQKVDKLAAIKSGSLYYYKNQSIYSYKEGKSASIQSGISNYYFINNNNYLQYGSVSEGAKLNSITSTAYLKDFSNDKTQTYAGTVRIMYCNNKLYFIKTAGYFSTYVVDGSGKTVVPQGVYETLFCLGDSFYFTQGEGASSSQLAGINISTQKPFQTDIQITGNTSGIFYNDEYFYYADSTKIVTYDTRLQKTETNAYGIKSALANNSDKIIYFVQPAVLLNEAKENQYSGTKIMKFDMNSKKVSVVANLNLSKEDEIVMKSADTFDSKFKQVIYDESNKIFYILFADKVYEVKN